MTEQRLAWWNRALLWTASVLLTGLLVQMLLGGPSAISWSSTAVIFLFASPGWLLFLPVILVMKNLRGWRSLALFALGTFVGALTGYAIPFAASGFDLLNHYWFTHKWDLELLWPSETLTFVFSRIATIFGSLTAATYLLLFHGASYWRRRLKAFSQNA